MDHTNDYVSDDEMRDKEQLLPAGDEQHSHIDQKHPQQRSISSNAIQWLAGATIVLALACIGLVFALYSATHGQTDALQVLTPVPSSRTRYMLLPAAAC